MERNVNMEDISDGKKYSANDMVKADTGNCNGCSDCCRGMGNSIVMDPYDIFNITKGTSYTFEDLLSKGYIQLNVVDGLILPNLSMNSTKDYVKKNGDVVNDACSFLDTEGRCSIHACRPGMCRLFPLGRIYEDGKFSYFLQVNECSNDNRSKVKVKKWLAIESICEYEEYISKWHYFLKDMSIALSKEDEAMAKQVNMFLLNLFFITPYNLDDFYGEFYNRLIKAGKLLG